MRSTVHTAPFSGVSSRMRAKEPSSSRQAVSASRSVSRTTELTPSGSVAVTDDEPTPSTT